MADQLPTELVDALLRAVPEAALIVGSDFRLIAANPAVASLLPSLRPGELLVRGLRSPDILDAITRAELQEWLAGALATEPRTVLLVTHDVEEALLLCDRVLVLAAGRVAAELRVDVARNAARREIVTSAPFVELRERALEAIG